MTQKTEQNYVVDTSFNWADEMDVAGCCILSESQIADYKTKLDKYYEDEDEIEYCCGTNEEAYFTKEKLIHMLEKAKPITPEEVEIITKFIPDGCLSNDIFEQILWEFEDEEEN